MEQISFLEQIASNFKERPEARAFVIGEKSYTYAELGSAIQEIRLMIEEGGAKTNYVGVYLSDDLATYASILALWFSGKAFIPVNPLFPSVRNREIMDQLDMKLLLSSEKMERERLPGGCSTIHTGALSLDVGQMPEPDPITSGGDAYVLFTSGSTGSPKGVRISFENLNAFARDFNKYPGYDFSPEDRFLQMYDLSFDGSIPCYVPPLMAGASVFTVPPSGIKYLDAYRIMMEHKLTFIKMSPSTLFYLRPYFDTITLPHVKYCLLGGEALPSSLVYEWSGCIPNALIQNVYGPTEVTIISLLYDVNIPGRSGKELNGTISIGNTIGSCRMQVVAADGQQVAAGETGELILAGEQVSPGYWNNPELNRQSFLTREVDGERIRFYHTGDMVQVDPAGDIMFLGRDDAQVQVGGYRVETGEVETAARICLDGASVVAMGVEQEGGGTMISLAVELEKVNESRLREQMEKRLPPYMIPGIIVAIPHFPRLVSGKLDRKAIRKLLS